MTGLLAAAVARHAAAPAILYGDLAISFAELDRRSRRVAAALAELGVGAGDRVALWLPNTPAYLVMCFGLARLGAVAVAVNTRFRSVEVADIVGRSGARVLAMWPGFRHIDFLAMLAEVEPQALRRLETLVLYDEGEAAPAIPGGLGHVRTVRYADLEARPPLEADRATPDAGCNVFTTSGTTRAPKFVLHRQSSIGRHAADVARGFGYAAGDGALLQSLPFCGVFGWSQAMAALAAGRPMVLTAAFDAGHALALIDRHDVRFMNATDDMILGLLDADRRERALPSVDHIGFAAFATDPLSTVQAAAARGVTLAGLYGMSEVQALYARQPLDANPERRAQGGGLPVSPEARIRVRDTATGRLLGPGEHGELELDGPSRFAEYLDNEAATRAGIDGEGFVRTGDLGYLTGDGGFVFLARMGDVLRLGGFLVNPAEIVAHLQAHPSVEAAQVVGVDTARDVRPVAFVVPRAGQAFDERLLSEHCLAGLAKFKLPARIVAVAEFPTTKSANGTKIQRARLREMGTGLLAG